MNKNSSWAVVMNNVTVTLPSHNKPVNPTGFCDRRDIFGKKKVGLKRLDLFLFFLKRTLKFLSIKDG